MPSAQQTTTINDLNGMIGAAQGLTSGVSGVVSSAQNVLSQLQGLANPPVAVIASITAYLTAVQSAQVGMASSLPNLISDMQKAAAAFGDAINQD